MSLKRRAAARALRAGQRIGLDVTPRSFYSATPHLRDLKARTDWRERRSMAGVQGADSAGQLAWLRSCCTAGRVRAADGCYERANTANDAVGFGPLEATALHCFMAEHAPPRVVQVGAGVASHIILEASPGTELICVDPYPTGWLRREDARGTLTLVERPAQQVPLELLTDLGPDGMLFVDSTHTVKPGSEVNRIVLEALPRLSRAWVFFHDVWWPYDHGADLLRDEVFFWSESVLLQAFLAGNPRWTVKAGLRQLHVDCPVQLRELFPSFAPGGLLDGLSTGEPGQRPAGAFLRVE
jgi:hypothetical protein